MLHPFVRLFIRMGISPDAVTLVGTLGVAAGALIFFPQGQPADRRAVHHRLRLQRPDRRPDGPRAWAAGSRFGAFWDSTLDRIGDGAIFGGLALYFAGTGKDQGDKLPLPLRDPVVPGDGLGDVVRTGAGGVAGHGRQGRHRRACRPPRLDPGDDRSGRALRPADPDGGHALGAGLREHLHGDLPGPEGTPPGAGPGRGRRGGAAHGHPFLNTVHQVVGSTS
ncbi:hypothetical protein [Nocardioides convexus]|uniref:hypothetical protein n=1 Tax=Nocardioides convexus TaxID=2712224 RepID=UPI003100B2A9